MTDRMELLKNWLAQLFPETSYRLYRLSGDASFRQYFRLSLPDQSFIVMDAPPDKEDCRHFANLAKAIKAQGLRVPHVFHADFANGFLVLSDFGDDQLFNQLNAKTADQLYRKAIKDLLMWQQVVLPKNLPVPCFDQSLYQYEFDLFLEWFLPKYCKVRLTTSDHKALNTVFQTLISCLEMQPQVFVHRDYHSRNLMVCDDGLLGILDFQDAVQGPITYDLVSLLKDCYIDWPQDSVVAWSQYYYNLHKHADLKNTSFEQFQQWFEWAGLQRHIKCLGIFSRLAFRDQKMGYLEAMPRVLQYVFQACAKYDEFKWFSSFLKKVLSEVSIGTISE